jgi:PPK2 family polyphosphate:nucleotide phosphotransferase
MSKKPSQYPGDQLRPFFIAPFRFSGSGDFHLKSHKTNAKGGLDKTRRKRSSRPTENAWAIFRKAVCAGPLVGAAGLQGMDPAGKDSAIKAIFDGVNPQGCEVHSFKQPSANELDHDFMWRHAVALPQRGHIGIFNRSYYEECLVTRVHREILAKEKLPSKLVTRNVWRERFEDISAFERYLSRNGTVILKFFLNISKEEQRKRFLDRLEEPSKNWKFSMGDVTERALWPRYMAAYQDLVRHTSTPLAPWYVVPADHKWFARVVIGSAIVSTLESLNLRFPRTDKASLQEFKQVHEALLAEGKGRVRKAVNKIAKRAEKGG